MELLSGTYYATSIANQIKNLLSFFKKPNDRNRNLIVKRFILLFKKHGIHHNEIARFFPDNKISYADIENDEKLLSKLTPDVIKATANFFCVRSKWLEGVDNIIYDMRDFYKSPKAYEEFIIQLCNNNPHRITAELVISNNPNNNYKKPNALLILKESVAINDDQIERYYLSGNWCHNYWKCRADLAACIAITIKHLVFINGWKTKANIENFCKGEAFIKDMEILPIVFKRDIFLRQHFEEWHPDYWLSKPNSFLEGIDGGVFGKQAALERWLKYYDDGLLETGYLTEEIRDDFKQAHLSISK